MRKDAAAGENRTRRFGEDGEVMLHVPGRPCMQNRDPMDGIDPIWWSTSIVVQ